MEKTKFVITQDDRFVEVNEIDYKLWRFEKCNFLEDFEIILHANHLYIISFDFWGEFVGNVEVVPYLMYVSKYEFVYHIFDENRDFPWLGEYCEKFKTEEEMYVRRAELIKRHHSMVWKEPKIDYEL